MLYHQHPSCSLCSSPESEKVQGLFQLSEEPTMEGDTFSGLGNGGQPDNNNNNNKVVHAMQTRFEQVQTILDQNRLLINQINHNHESRIPDNLTRNVGLIRELNGNIRRVVGLYADLSASFTKSFSDGGSAGTPRKRGRSG